MVGVSSQINLFKPLNGSHPKVVPTFRGSLFDFKQFKEEISGNIFQLLIDIFLSGLGIGQNKMTPFLSRSSLTYSKSSSKIGLLGGGGK